MLTSSLLIETKYDIECLLFHFFHDSIFSDHGKHQPTQLRTIPGILSAKTRKVYTRIKLSLTVKFWLNLMEVDINLNCDTSYYLQTNKETENERKKPVDVTVGNKTSSLFIVRFSLCLFKSIQQSSMYCDVE